ncbi:MAG: methionine adenosyltransferase [Desulfuromonadales bacterium]|nr:methionine adenosyltransferase [Desulfuromonadales bacterium]
MLRIVVEQLLGPPMAERQVEIVERKGKGHPDTMCDSMLEAISVALSRYYLQEFGTVLHHNIDKGLLAAGMVKKWFGGGEVLKPMELFIGDRATMKADDTEIPVAEIAIEAAQNWLRSNLRFVDAERHMTYQVVLASGSEELTDIFVRSGGVRAANDTSAAVGYYPLSPTEKAVLELETYLNSPGFKERFPETGEDVKIMGVRHQGELELTVAMPLLSPFVLSEADYFARKEAICRDMLDFGRRFSSFNNVDLHFNTLDTPGRGLGGVYLSLLGTSAEDADSGEVGRGNKVNGLIPVGRPIGGEAVAGKNPVSHIGKIYNILAHRLARQIYEEIDGLKEVYTYLVVQIGTPIDQPQIAAVQIISKPGIRIEDVSQQVEELIQKELAGINDLCIDLIHGRYPVC